MGLMFSISDIPEQVALKIRERAQTNQHSLQEELLAILIAAAREAPPTRAERGIEDALRRWRGVFPKAAAAGGRTSPDLVGARLSALSVDAAVGRRDDQAMARRQSAGAGTVDYRDADIASREAALRDDFPDGDEARRAAARR